MRLQPGIPAIDFVAQTISGVDFRLSDLKGTRILLSFFRNGACAMCNLRVRELIQNYNRFRDMKIEIVTVFESSIEAMVPYVGKQAPPFPLLADPAAIAYDLYQVESSEEKINNVIANKVAEERIREAASQGFLLTKQEGSNFFRLPADFLIDEDFTIQKSHYSDQVIDHLEIDAIMEGFGRVNQGAH